MMKIIGILANHNCSFCDEEKERLILISFDHLGDYDEYLEICYACVALLNEHTKDGQ